jgi:hypothetical protein
MRFLRPYLPGFLIGAVLIWFVAWALGLPRGVYCYEANNGHEECATYYVASVAFSKLGEALNWIAPALTAIATGFIAWFTLTLKKSTDTLAQIADNTAKTQSEETEILQRAYISAEPRGIGPFLPRDLTAPPTNKTFVGHVGFRNAGRLPARNVQWYMDAECSTDADYKPIRFGELTGRNIISPGETMTQGSIEKNIPDDRLGYFFVWGKIVYDDGFGNERKTVFCHRYNLRRLERGKGSDGGFFRIRRRYGRHHDKGNDAD